jgi:beta-glucosidase
VSHYQVEGGDECDWSEWERAGRARGGPCGQAVQSWQRYEDDVELARSVGCNAFRFSVSWSRVEPRRGMWNDAALDRYSALVDRLVAHDIEPVATLFHYTHPVWFHDATPWTHPSSVDAFARFARVVAARLGGRVRLWTILNEPLVFVLAGFLDGQIPPGLADPASAIRAWDHLLAAHCAAAAEIREVDPGAAIGVAHNMMAFAPDRSGNLLDRLVARAAHRFYNEGPVEAFATGRWNMLLPPFSRFRGKRDDLPASTDFFGVNFYSRLHLRSPGRRRRLADWRYDDRTGRGLTDNGWEIAPGELHAMLHTAAAGGMPLVVTENGLADESDRLRPAFLEDHVAQLLRAREEGLPLHGFFHWSLLDNFEWLEGFAPRFGLFEVDRETMERRPRASAETFRRIGREVFGCRA